jgi:hypothetical protein
MHCGHYLSGITAGKAKLRLGTVMRIKVYWWRFINSMDRATADFCRRRQARHLEVEGFDKSHRLPSAI